MLSRASGIFNSEQFNEIFPQEKVVKLWGIKEDSFQ
jgi:hypothetical protein